MKVHWRDGEYEVSDRKDMEIVKAKRNPYPWRDKGTYKLLNALIGSLLVVLAMCLILGVLSLLDICSWPILLSPGCLVMYQITFMGVYTSILCYKRMSTEEKVAMYVRTKRRDIEMCIALVVAILSFGIFYYEAYCTEDAKYLNSQIEKAENSEAITTLADTLHIENATVIKWCKSTTPNTKQSILWFSYITQYVYALQLEPDEGSELFMLDEYTGTNESIRWKYEAALEVSDVVNSFKEYINEVLELSKKDSNEGFTEEDTARLNEMKEEIAELQERVKRVTKGYTAASNIGYEILFGCMLISIVVVIRRVLYSILYHANLRKLRKEGII